MAGVRLGLIGLGLIGIPHSQTLQRVGECELVAVADVDPTHQATAASLGVHYYSEYTEMIRQESLDGVIIATPNHLHVPIGVGCAAHGLHLFVEKPIAVSLPEANQLLEAAEKNHVRILVGHQRRFNARVEKARQIIHDGELGRLVGATATWAMLKPPQYFEGPFAWRKDKGGGPIMINLIHEIDNLRYMCGEIDEVFAVSSRRVRAFPVEDTAAITIRFRSGAVGTVFLSDCVPSMSAFEATTGENPLIPHDFGNCYHFYGTAASLRFPQLKKLYYAGPAEGSWHTPITEQVVHVRSGEDAYVKEFRHFARVIRGEEAARCSGEDARTTLAVTIAVQQSGEKGQPVRLA